MSIQSNINNAIHSIGTLSGLARVVENTEDIEQMIGIEKGMKEQKQRDLGVSQGEGAQQLAGVYSQTYKDVNETAFGDLPNTPSAIGGSQSQQALMQMSAKDAWIRAKMGLQDAQTAKAMKGGRHNQMRMRSGTKEERNE